MSIIKKYNQVQQDQTVVPNLRSSSPGDEPSDSENTSHSAVGTHKTLLKGALKSPDYFEVPLISSRPRQRPSSEVSFTHLSPEPEEPIFQAPVEPSGEVDMGMYRQNAQSQVDTELRSYRQQKLKEAEIEKQTILEGAYQEGFNRGKKEAEQKFSKQGQDFLKAINDIVREKQAMLQDSKKDILTLAVSIAEKIIGQELSIHPQGILHIVEESLRRVTDRDKITIKANPQDVLYLNQHRDELLQKMPDVKNLEIIEEDRLQSGSCIIETSMGYIDSSISSKMDIIKKALHDAYDEDAGS